MTWVTYSNSHLACMYINSITATSTNTRYINSTRCTLHLLACQVRLRVAIGDLGLCCVCMMSFKHQSTVITHQEEYRPGQHCTARLVLMQCELPPSVRSCPKGDTCWSAHWLVADAVSLWSAGWCCLSCSHTCQHKYHIYFNNINIL